MYEKHTYHPIETDPTSGDGLLSSDEEFTPYQPLERPKPSRKWIRYLNLTSHILAWALVVILSYCVIRTRTWGYNRFRQQKGFPAQLTYSPAQDSIEYEVKVFRQGFETRAGGVDPEFTGPPSDRLDKAWSDLYNCKPDPRVVMSKTY